MNTRSLLFFACWIVQLLLLSSCASISENNLLAPARSWPQLGVRLRVVDTGEIPASLVGERSRVLLVTVIKPEQPAARAGVRPGDYLLALDHQSVSGMSDSVAQMQTHDWGDEVLLTVLRNEQLKNIAVLLEP